MFIPPSQTSKHASDRTPCLQVCTQADQGHDYVLAVNYWYDMPFDARWAYFRAVEALSIQMGLTQVVE